MTEDYRQLAEKARSLARRLTDPRTIEVLERIAADYDARAQAAASAPAPRPEPEPPGSD